MTDAESIQTSFAQTSFDERKKAYSHLHQKYPYLSELFSSTGEVGPRDEAPPCISETVVRIIAGQMLSGPAAETIYRRLRETAVTRGLAYTHLLAVEDIRKCGLSARKARSIGEFSQLFRDDPRRFEAWGSLDYGPLRKDVSSLWGLSDWSASIIALSHYKMPDVWPAADGSIQRAVSAIRHTYDSQFNPDDGAPYRSYLARSLWAALDSGRLK